MSKEADAAKKWKWCNTETPDKAKSISILALIEAAAAVVVYTWIAFKWGTLHLTVSACIAPFLLLRTRKSTEVGIKIGRTAHGIPEWFLILSPTGSKWTQHLLAPIFFISFGMSIAVSAIIVRVLATVITVIRHPLTSLKSIPENWWRFVAKIDTSTRAEAVPGVVSAAPGLNTFDVSDLLRLFKRIPSDFEDWIAFLLFLPIYIICVFIPVLLYRWSVKGTSLVYSPLIYIVHSSLGQSALELARNIKGVALHKVTRAYAAFVILLFVGKLYLFMSWSAIATMWQDIPSIDIINAYVVPEAIPPWHLAVVINALITWIVFFVADVSLVKANRSGDPEKISAWVGHFIQKSWFFRGLLSLYSVACVLYISASLIPTIDWPPIGSKIFPWW